MAMEQAVAKLLEKINSHSERMHVIVDGNVVLNLAFPCTAIIKGDAKSKSIAAASIIAKVTRDRLMIKLDSVYPQYGFAKHKGYPTKEHRDILEKLGPSRIHRKTFSCV
jgi:ribonuclease HII